MCFPLPSTKPIALSKPYHAQSWNIVYLTQCYPVRARAFVVFKVWDLAGMDFLPESPNWQNVSGFPAKYMRPKAFGVVRLPKEQSEIKDTVLVKQRLC